MIIDKACFEHLNRFSQLKIFFSIFCFCIVVYTLQGRIQGGGDPPKIGKNMIFLA